MAKRIGNVYWANSQKIDRTDKKKRRQYAVTKDNGRNVGVSKIRGYNDNEKNIDRLYVLDMNKYPLSKRSGVDKKIYSKRADNNKLLRLEDNDIFDINPVFKLSSHDTHRVLNHTGSSNKRKQKKGESIKLSPNRTVQVGTKPTIYK